MGDELKLTRNEKKTLKLLLENAKISDSAIAVKLHISSQAVGKIRRKLEATVIDSYTLHLDYSKLGIHMFALSLAHLTSEGSERGTTEIEQRLIDDPHVIQVYRAPKGNGMYIVLYGFRDVDEMDYFFHSNHKKKELHSLVEPGELFTFSYHSFLKNCPTKLYFKAIDNLGGEMASMGFRKVRPFDSGLRSK